MASGQCLSSLLSEGHGAGVALTARIARAVPAVVPRVARRGPRRTTSGAPGGRGCGGEGAKASADDAEFRGSLHTDGDKEA